MFLALLLPDTLLFRPLLLLRLTLLCFSLAALLFLLASLLACRIALFPALLPNALRCSLLAFSLALLLSRLTLLCFSLPLLLSLLLSLLAFRASLLLFLILGLSWLLIVLAAAFLPISTAPTPLRVHLNAGANHSYRREGQHCREALEKIKSHGSS